MIQMKNSFSFTNQTMIFYHLRFKFLSWSPIISISAKENKRVKIIFKEIEKIRDIIDMLKVRGVATTDTADIFLNSVIDSI